MNRFGVSVIYFDAAGLELGFSLPLIIVSIIRRPLTHMMSLIGSEDSDSALGVQWACSRHPGPTPIRALPHSSEIRSSWPISPPPDQGEPQAAVRCAASVDCSPSMQQSLSPFSAGRRYPPRSSSWLSIAFNSALVACSRLPSSGIRWRTGHGAKNMAIVRRFALGLVRADKRKGSVKTKRKSAGWNPDYLRELLQLK
jgi:hypothetical protein